jgi:hypothetical protein
VRRRGGRAENRARRAAQGPRQPQHTLHTAHGRWSGLGPFSWTRGKGLPVGGGGGACHSASQPPRPGVKPSKFTLADRAPVTGAGGTTSLRTVAAHAKEFSGRSAHTLASRKHTPTRTCRLLPCRDQRTPGPRYWHGGWGVIVPGRPGRRLFFLTLA